MIQFILPFLLVFIIGLITGYKVHGIIGQDISKGLSVLFKKRTNNALREKRKDEIVEDWTGIRISGRGEEERYFWIHKEEFKKHPTIQKDFSEAELRTILGK